MLRALKQCLPWLNGQTIIVTALAIMGIAVCIGLPTMSSLTGIVPLLVIAACLLPGLLPIIFSRKKHVATVVKPEMQQK